MLLFNQLFYVLPLCLCERDLLLNDLVTNRELVFEILIWVINFVIIIAIGRWRDIIIIFVLFEREKLFHGIAKLFKTIYRLLDGGISDKLRRCCDFCLFILINYCIKLLNA